MTATYDKSLNPRTLYMRLIFLNLEQNGRSRKSSYSATTNTDLRSSIILSSTNSSQNVDNLQNEADDDEADIALNSASVIEIDEQNKSVKETLHSNKFPFETDKSPFPKKTASRRKSAMEVYQLFEKQFDGTYKCTLCTDEEKVAKFYCRLWKGWSKKIF